ncbi:MAG TPA: hypothetical protein DCW31_10235 [Lactobacillus sp.]|nr:hypothetical protein [Lactobacillus sp.]
MKTIFATVHVQPGREGEFRIAAEKLVFATRGESGNQEFNLYHGAGCPSDFLFTETYTGETAIEKHRQEPHFQTFLKELETFVNAPMDVMIFNGNGTSAEDNQEENTTMITINATVYVKDDKISNYGELAQTLIAGTHNEPGNLRYDMYQSTERPGEFVFIEQYANQAALDAHHVATHFTSFLKRVEPLMAKEMTVVVFREMPTTE